MTFHLPIRVTSMVVAMLVGLALPAATLADDGATTDQAAPTSHCVALPNEATQCFATFGAGVSFATGGRVTSGDPDTAMRLVAATPLAGLEIRAILFVDGNYGGSTFTIYDYDVCTFKQPSMASGWDNVVSSVQIGSRCGISLFENSSYGGAQLNVRSNTSYVGNAMNDRTSSWKLFVR